MLNLSDGETNVTGMPFVQQLITTFNNSNNNNNNKNVIINNNKKNNLHKIKMQKLDMNAPLLPVKKMSTIINEQPTTLTATQTNGGCSPPDFDFNLPCRYFKSSFARSLSLTNHNQCKSLDFDINYRNNQQQQQQQIMNTMNKNNNNNNIKQQYSNNAAQNDGPPLPQRIGRATTTTTTTMSTTLPTNVKNEANIICCNNNDAKPPAIPARRAPPITGGSAFAGIAVGNSIETEQQNQLQQLQQLQQTTKQFRNVANELTTAATTAIGSTKSTIVAVGNYDKINNQTVATTATTTTTITTAQMPRQQMQRQQQQQQQQQQQTAINHSNSNINAYKRNGWPRDPVEQDCNHCADAENVEATEFVDVDATIEHETMKMSTSSSSTSSTSSASLTADFTGNNAQLESRPAAFEVHDNKINVEVVFLQNQVDTLQWQLKQVETSCEMYRAVMEEVARFLDRYHNQRQQQRQLQQQLQQQQQNNRNSNSNINLEQISRSKSLYHVNGVGGHEKNYTGNDLVVTTTAAAAKSTSTMPTAYLRTRSSTNLIDLKPPTSLTKQTTTATSTTTAKTTQIGISAADDQIYDGIAPAQSYSAFKDFTWRRSPRKVNDSKSMLNVNNAEEKLNQEAFRLSRTIHNLLNTSTQQPDLTQHRNSLAAVSLGRLTKTPSSSIMNLHQHATNQIHNSTSLSAIPIGVDTSSIDVVVVNGGGGVGGVSGVSGVNEAFDTISHATTIATKTSKMASTQKGNNNNALAVAEMLFLRSNTMRDSRLSLRSSTDSSVHSTTSSAASSSSKVETDEELSPPFHNHHHNHHHLQQQQQQQQTLTGSTTEDESGFSSINSFQDITPLSSTLLSNAPIKSRHLGAPRKNNDSDTNSSEANSLHEFNVIDSRNSTLKAAIQLKQPLTANTNSNNNNKNNNNNINVNVITTTTNALHPTNIVGVPHELPTPLQHQRWSVADTAAKTYRNANKMQRFSTLSNEKMENVLWV